MNRSVPNDVDLTVCIVSWNTLEPLREALGSLRRHAGELRLQVIVVDNASEDGSPEMVAEEFPEVLLLRQEENRGFGRANNLAIRRARGKTVLLLNPDIVVREGSLQAMLAWLEGHPEAGVVGPRLVNRDGSVQKSWWESFPTLRSELARGLLLHRLTRPQAQARQPVSFGRTSAAEPGAPPAASTARAEARAVACIAGACLLFPREVLHILGGFDPGYFMYGEDMDLCWRVHGIGRQVWYLDGVEILHHHGAASGRQSRPYFATLMQKQSRYRFLKTHRGRTAAAGFRVAWILSGLWRSLLFAPVWAASVLFFRRKRAIAARSLITALHTVRWGFGMERWTLR